MRFIIWDRHMKITIGHLTVLIVLGVWCSDNLNTEHHTH